VGLDEPILIQDFPSAPLFLRGKQSDVFSSNQGCLQSGALRTDGHLRALAAGALLENVAEIRKIIECVECAEPREAKQSRRAVGSKVLIERLILRFPELLAFIRAPSVGISVLMKRSPAATNTVKKGLPDFSKKLLQVTLSEKTNTYAIDRPTWLMRGDRLFLVGRVPHGSSRGDWLKGTVSAVAWDQVAAYFVFDSAENYRKRLKIFGTAKAKAEP
jgi:hypothetical protein